MIAAGVNAKALSTYMGHTSITITLDHRCVTCGERVTMKAADWRASTFGEPRVEHFTCRRAAGSPGFGPGLRVL